MEEKLNQEDRYTISALFKRAKEYRSSAEYINFIQFIERFNHYSRYNTMLVYTQNRAVTFFGGESYWKKKFRRTIKEDARPYIILAPGGPVMLVYDIFDTEGELTPQELLEEGLGSNPHKVNGELNESRLIDAIDLAQQWGIVVKKRPLSYFNGGFVTTIVTGKLEINLKEELGAAEQFSVLIHELAHLFLGHTGHKELIHIEKTKKLRIEPRRLNQNAEELEAETVSYLILKRLGLTSKSAEYIAGYIKSDSLLQEVNYEMIIKVADKIESLFIPKHPSKKALEIQARNARKKQLITLLKAKLAQQKELKELNEE
ncbi:protein of unknown function [Saccharicrinis carchari]|uniref:IrrE N-terminal-like domain-containing protein n=1 Tax=Saccharicrinis carchari TaxID=1168039 RepID=A0A521E160_SACCC|nr:ImmA/IrrE family metallo-endopeptidase [Saccharicrinis carchari]SMO77696.1 protein of unknown function [Saccharicrinis carchari]